MKEYTPDRWVVLEFDSVEYGKYRKVLASWYGGFAGSDNWKLSSSIDNIVIAEDEFYSFYNSSGSVYYCHKS